MGCFASSTIDENKIIVGKNLNKKKLEDESKKEKKEEKKEEIEEVEGKEETEDKKEYKLKLNLHILVKTLESKKIPPKEIKEKVNDLFKDLEKNKKEEIENEDIIKKISNIFIEYLKPINKENIQFINNLIGILYENNKSSEKNLDNLNNYLLDVLENINQYYTLTNEDEKKIDDYLIKVLRKNEKINDKKEELKNKYKNNNYYIKYKDFTTIVKDYKIFINDLEIDYLLYKMKCGVPLDKNLTLDYLNFKIFLDYLDKKEVENDLNENKKINNKEEKGDHNIKNIGINLSKE